MIVIVGESASGKSTLAKMITEYDHEYKRIITYTTRPPREGEIDGMDYHFVSKEEFKKNLGNGSFAEYAEYNGWWYGTLKKDCMYEKSIAVLTPSGLRSLKRCGIDIFSIYLYVDRRSRLIKILERGDDIEESYRRNLSDVGQFDGIECEVDGLINNVRYHKDENEILNEALDLIRGNKQ